MAENYETHVVRLWLDNDEGSYRYWQGRVEEIMRGVDYDDTSTECGQLADALKDEHEESLPEVNGFAQDLLTAAMGKVEWYKIAEAMISEYIENNPVEAAS